MKRLVALLYATEDPYSADITKFMETRKKIANYLRHAGMEKEAEKLYEETGIVDVIVTSPPHTLREDEVEVLKKIHEYFYAGEEYEEGTILYRISRTVEEYEEIKENSHL